MTSHTKPHMLLWVDTETTGLDPDRCDLLEIACTITDMRAEQSFDQHHAVIHPDHGIAITHADDLTALRMHLANGLLEASLGKPDSTSPNTSTTPPDATPSTPQAPTPASTCGRS